VPVAVRSNYKGIWEEYQSNKTQVAKFVHKLDKLEMALQATQYINEGHPNKMLFQFLDSVRISLAKFNVNQDNQGHDDIIIEILNSLMKSIVK
jgi:putative hydrolase of HD superfamily